MRQKSKVLFKTPFISVCELDVPKLNMKYFYLHESRCDGNLVAVLPFKKENNKILYGLRKEICPPWDKDKFTICSLTGGVDKGTPREAAQLELKEEAGIFANYNDFIFLGKTFRDKASDTIVHLYAIDITGKEIGEATTDGTEAEKVSSMIWEEDISKSLDPLSYTLFYKLQQLNSEV